MGAPSGSTSTPSLSILESYAQPNATRLPEEVETQASSSDFAEVDGSTIRKRPSIVIGGDSNALAAVRVVHSPRSSTSISPSRAGAIVASPKIRGAWRRKILGSGWTGPADAVLSVGGLIFTIAYYGAFLRWNETRSDVSSRVSLSDPVLRHLPSIDFSRTLSVLVYGSLLAAWKYAYKKPDLFLEFVQTHTIVMWVRMLVLYLTPLEAPDGTVPLVDPIAQPDGVVLVRDLFFSGHTATTFGLFICTRRNDRLWKMVFGVVSLVTASLVLVQKAHYTVDVVAAPFFVHTTHSCALHLRQVFGSVLGRTEKTHTPGSFHAKPKKL